MGCWGTEERDGLEQDPGVWPTAKPNNKVASCPETFSGWPGLPQRGIALGHLGTQNKRPQEMCLNLD
jgi:hypothetical protein